MQIFKATHTTHRNPNCEPTQIRLHIVEAKKNPKPNYHFTFVGNKQTQKEPIETLISKRKPKTPKQALTSKRKPKTPKQALISKTKPKHPNKP
jgi:hypothetical protein